MSFTGSFSHFQWKIGKWLLETKHSKEFRFDKMMCYIWCSTIIEDKVLFDHCCLSIAVLNFAQNKTKSVQSSPISSEHADDFIIWGECFNEVGSTCSSVSGGFVSLVGDKGQWVNSVACSVLHLRDVLVLGHFPWVTVTSTLASELGG